jgi:predicted Zn-dependent protease
MEQEKVSQRGRASHPGRVRLSRERLKAFHPELFSCWEWRLHLLFAAQRYPDKRQGFWVGRIARHLRRGDSRAAVVVRSAPDVIVAAYTDELDCVALLEFDQSEVTRRKLKEGDRLLCVNAYGSGEAYEPDLAPGPARREHYNNFTPLIADFLTEDAERVRLRKEEISLDEWERVWRLGRYALAAGQTVRYGRPLLAGSAVPGKRARRGGPGRKTRHVLRGVGAAACVMAVLLAVMFFIAFWGGAGSRAPFVAVDVRGVQRPGKVFLVPLNDFPAPTLEELARHYGAKYGTPVEVKPHVRTPPAAYNEQRKQLVAEEVVAGLRREYPAARGEPQNVIIGVTADDIYIRAYNWRYAYSYRLKGAAVVSTARMDAGWLIFMPKGEAERRRSRLRKMVAKNIGVLYYELPLSDDPRSLLYSDVGGPRALDRMGEDF